MRVLVACEMSGRVRQAFRDRGHDAYSVDLLPSLDNSEHHITGDVSLVLGDGWDLLIAHPPCTFLCNSGVRWLRTDPNRFWDMILARKFFKSLWNADIPKICIENPVPHGYAQLPKYSQTIQPYMFGDDASKRTCLWFKNVDPLVIPHSDLWAPPRIVDGKKRWANQTDSGQNKETPALDRGMKRSLTYPGIAQAFAQNWG